MSKVVLELSESNARALSDEYDALIDRKSSSMADHGWDRQSRAIEAELSDADFGTKVSRLLAYHVDGVEIQ